jgi:hypothetical protein
VDAVPSVKTDLIPLQKRKPAHRRVASHGFFTAA